jgi:hypothetical protein
MNAKNVAGVEKNIFEFHVKANEKNNFYSVKIPQ